MHDEAGLDEWVRSTANALAEQGFLAVAPDLLTGVDLPGSGPAAVQMALEAMDEDRVQRRVWAAGVWARALPATTDRYGIVGFVWGGGVAFGHASRDAELGAAVVYDGRPPRRDFLRTMYAPVLGLYGGEENTPTAEAAEVQHALAALGRDFQLRVFPGARRGFARDHGESDANGKAAVDAWQETLSFFRAHLE